MRNNITKPSGMTIGIDVSDKYSQICILNDEGTVIEESRIPTTQDAFGNKFSCPPRRIAIEVGTHSMWINRLLKELGHEVLVANPRKLRMIYQNDSKDDKVDALMLARTARLDPELLYPIEHRNAEAQQHLEIIKARDTLVSTRTALINHVRGAAKPLGYKLPKCTADSFSKKVAPHIPESLWPSLSPLLDMIGTMTAKIRDYERQIEILAKNTYPVAEVLCQVNGVGALTALAYVLTIGDPYRFKKSRILGSYFGLRPRRDDSGERKTQLRITKAGNSYMRRLLVGSANYILGPFGKDCDLRRWGLSIVQRGGKAAKKRATIAVARKLAVLLHRLWVTGEVYEPFRKRAEGAGEIGSTGKGE